MRTSLPGSPVPMPLASERFRRWSSLLQILLFLALPGCSTDVARRPSGELCGTPNECETGICGGGACLEPEADRDLDGLTNRIEAVLGSDPAAADTDRDGIDDFTETRGGYVVDTDGDGLPDVVESMLADRDGDCVPDQLDPRNEVFDGDLSGLVPIVCRTVGVCRAAPLVVTCENGKGPRCDYGAVPDWEVVETLCDGKDNDCNGTTDEGHPDLDSDGLADCVDDDRDGDGVADSVDLCPDIEDINQIDNDGDGVGDACDPPAVPVLLQIRPRSPSSERQPMLSFTAEPLTTLRVFADAACRGLSIGSITAPPRNAPVPGFDVQITVPRNAESRLSVRATNSAELSSACLPMPSYEHDDQPPEAPLFVSASPPSPSRMRRVTFSIAAPSTSKVSSFELHLNRDCLGSPHISHTVTGTTPLTFTIEAPPNTETAISGVSFDAAGNRSECTLVTAWRHDSLSPCPPRLADNRRTFTTSTPDLDLIAEGAGSVAIFGDAQCANLLAPATRVGSGELALGSCQALWRAPVRLPRDGVLPVWGRAIDAATNASACALIGQLRYDLTPPTPPTLLHLRASGWRTGTVTFLGRGSSEPDGRIQIFVGTDNPPDCAATPVLTVGTETDGSFRFAVETQATGVHWLRLRAIDNAGNISTCGPAEPLVGPVDILVPPLAGPSSLLISDESGGIIEEIQLLTTTPAGPTAPRSLARTIVRGASVSLAHQIVGSDNLTSENRILSHMDLQPFETITFGRGWYPRATAGLPVEVVVQQDTGNSAYLLVVRCADNHWESIEIQDSLPAVTTIPPGCLVPGAETFAWLRPASSAGPTTGISFTTPTPGPTPHQLRFGPWQPDSPHVITITGPRTPAGGLALLVDPANDASGLLLPNGPRAPQFWLELARGWNIDTTGDRVPVEIPSIRAATTSLQQHMLLLIAFDVFERITLATLIPPVEVMGVMPAIDLDAHLPSPIGLFIVETAASANDPGRPATLAVFPQAPEPLVTTSFVEVRWNALAVEAPPLVWQVVQSSQRTETRFPDLPAPPSLLARMSPPTTSAEIRNDLDRAIYAVYLFEDGRSLVAARPILAADLFNANLAGPPILPRSILYRSMMSPGRFSFTD